MPAIIVENRSSGTIYTFVSKYTDSKGDDSWFKLTSGASDSWARNKGWELVAFKDEHDTRREGVYVPVDKKVTFYNLDDIRVE